MKKTVLLLVSLAVLQAGPLKVSAQNLDPSFAALTVYAPGFVSSAIEQPDGKIVMTGLYSRVNGAPAFAISRFNPNGTPDAAFQQNVGTATAGYRVRLLSNGQMVLNYNTTAPFTVGGISRQTLLRLNADGTGDASFNLGTGPAFGTSISYIDDYLPLANGQLLVVGGFDHINGVAVPSGIARLTATGAPDPTFNPGTGIDVNNDDLLNVVTLPNGKLLVGGLLSTYNGVTRNGIARLNADGTLDTAFTSPLDVYSEVDDIVVQPDGNILIWGTLNFASGNTKGIVRLLPDGALDPTFNAPANVGGGFVSSYSGDALQLQPDGKVLAINNNASSGLPGVVRLNANGTPDAGFQVGAGPNAAPTTVTLLSTGKILVGGNFTNFSGTYDRPLVQLTSTGAVDATFQPLVQTTGQVVKAVLQPDGKLVAGGTFSEVNGQAVRRLARFNANGTVDASFTNSLSPNDQPVDLVLQPNGNLLVATQGAVVRLLPTGAADASFNASGLAGSFPSRLLLQPDGKVLVGGSLLNNGTLVTPPVVRLLSDGSRDATFAPSGLGASRFQAFHNIALQADGKVLLAASYSPTATGSYNRTLLRLSSTGALDNTFTGAAFNTPAFNTGLNALQVQPDGKILVGGQFSTYGGTARSNVARLNPDGTLDAGFVPPTTTGAVYSLLLQPNNRVLLGGSFSSSSLPRNLARLLPTGAADASFAATAVPNGIVRTLLVQPDGKIVAGGGFTTIGGQTSSALTRLIATDVLTVRAPQAVADRTAAWPVPAHAALTVAPDASAHPQALDLLDALGRPVLHQALSNAAPATLATETLAPGSYLLRVTYAEGTVTRRVQVQ
ncbi:T9SS type A sorting domain-containing protein [Hymenobacter ruricola]|uniref:T9SS type A sorting domain-containing protein n=1 Tax=Hymenobacter ruricola TaxID=2791023 RepID=A0ABS0I0G4_9BACT|nr:T9SS type A sorting domain-containing protein [Hymenobacter ruricola]MBF9220399.1 T9SS type A sorting domain-containing protein [Hymenobacter ruricola]